MDSSSTETSQSPCGVLRRLIIMLYDALVIVAILMLAAFIALPVTGDEQMALRDPVYTAFLLLVWFIYLAICWRRGATLGMRAWRVQMVSDEGRSEIPGWGRCAARFVLAWVSAAAAGLGYLWMLFDRRRRCWHDIATGTALVRLSAAAPK